MGHVLFVAYTASSQYLSDVSDKPSEIIVSRTDYNPGAAHKFAFTLQTHGRRIDVVADNEQTYRMWIDGLRCLQVRIPLYLHFRLLGR